MGVAERGSPIRDPFGRVSVLFAEPFQLCAAYQTHESSQFGRIMTLYFLAVNLPIWEFPYNKSSVFPPAFHIIYK
jgi:hypothetical protein